MGGFVLAEGEPYSAHMKRVLPRVGTVAESDLVMFDCPGCQGVDATPHRLRVFFAGKNRDEGNEKQWDAWGRTIDDLTLSPEVQMYGCSTQFWVRGGDVVLSGKTGIDWIHDI